MIALLLLAACHRPPAVVVVGGGPAGMAAAIEASEGARVTLVEGEPILGGVARLSMGVTALPTEADLARWDAAAGGPDPMRTRYAREVRPEVVDWLGGLGVSWRPMDNPVDGVALVGPEGGGAALVQAMEAEVRRREVVVRTGLRVVDARPGWTVDLADGTTLEAGALVLATGGWAADLARARTCLGLPADAPMLAGSPAFADGNGHELAARLGGVERAPCQVMLYTHGVPDVAGRTHMLVGADPAWVVDREGAPLEVAPRGGGNRREGWAIFDSTGAERARLWSLDAEALVDLAPVATALGTVADRPESLDASLGLPAGTTARGIAPDTEATTPERPLRARPPFLALPLRPTTAKVLTGMETDDAGRVLDASGQPIPGLYAVGELAGFGHPFGTTAMDSTMVALAVLTGRSAGEAVIADRTAP